LRLKEDSIDMNTLILILTAVFLVSCEDSTSGVLSSPEKKHVIYGEDTRQDLSSANLVYPAKASAMLIIERNLKPLNAKFWDFRKFTLQKGYPLCQTEKFLDQYLLGFCSGVLISSTRVLTAGHCIRNQNNCDETYLLFGFTQDKAIRGQIPTSEIYKCKKLIAQENGSSQGGRDYALIELDRQVINVQPVEIIDSKNLSLPLRVVSLSYPLGLPLKADVGSMVRNESWSNFIEAQVDTFAGSSGSGLFSSEGKLLGILSQGSDDFLEEEIRKVQTSGGCIKVNNCASGTCHNERYFRASLIPLP
jgi:Trypsin-like peptidase domain